MARKSAKVTGAAQAPVRVNYGTLNDGTAPGMLRNIGGLLANDQGVMDSLARVAAGRDLDDGETVEFDLPLETAGRLLMAMADFLDASLREKAATKDERAALDAMVAIMRPLAETGHRVRRPFDQANANSSNRARDEHAAWQAEADRLWSDPVHADKSKSNIARLVARRLGGNESTIRRRIRKLA